MILITEAGHRLPVSADSLPTDLAGEVAVRTGVKAALIDDSICLEPVWILRIFDRHWTDPGRPSSAVEEQIFLHRPTREEILQALALHGPDSHSFATVEKGYELGERSSVSDGSGFAAAHDSCRNTAGESAAAFTNSADFEHDAEEVEIFTISDVGGSSAD